MTAYRFGYHWSYNFRNDPKRLGFVLSRYQFAAKMVGKGKVLLELGCSDGIGIPFLAKHAKSYTGVDLDRAALEGAKANHPEKKCRFIEENFMGREYGIFDGIISLDVVEHIPQELEDLYFRTLYQNLNDAGVCVVGTPNITAASHASLMSEAGHINLYSQERLVSKMRESFHHVFPFGMNDEIVHTGFGPMAHYLICVACHKKEELPKR